MWSHEPGPQDGTGLPALHVNGVKHGEWYRHPFWSSGLQPVTKGGPTVRLSVRVSMRQFLAKLFTGQTLGPQTTLALMWQHNCSGLLYFDCNCKRG